MTAWTDYLTAIDDLDATRRDAARTVASQERSAHAARIDLAGVRRRIAAQRTRIADIATRANRPLPVVEPQPPERANAATIVPTAIMDPTPAVSAALKSVRAMLDTSDAALALAAQKPSRGGLLPGWTPVGRNALPYSWYALLATIALVFVNGSGSTPGAQTVALGLDVIVPACAYLLGIVSVTLLFAPGRDGRKPKNLLLGLLICAVPLAVGVALSLL